MKFKLIIALVDVDQTETVIDVARAGGATGSTIIGSARGEGLTPAKTFLGLDIEDSRDMVLLLVEAHLSRGILETLTVTCKFDESPGSGIAFQIDIEDAVGLTSQIGTISSEIEDQI